MQDSDIPTFMPTPFASGAGGAYKRVVPIPSQIPSDPSQASFTDGFPPNTFLPVGSGGTGPEGKDFNGLFLAVTQWLRWFQAGGPITYNSAFASAVGGYPAGTVLQSAVTPGLFWLNAADANTSDPDGGSPVNWSALTPHGAAGGVLNGSYPNPGLANGVVSNAKLANMSATTVKANLTGGAATPADWTVAQLAGVIAAGLPSSLGPSGYRTNLDGSIEQWMTVAPGDDNYVSYALPTAFPNEFWGAVGTIRFNNVPSKTGGNGGGAFTYPIDLSHVGVGIAWNGDATGISSVFVRAIGR